MFNQENNENAALESTHDLLGANPNLTDFLRRLRTHHLYSVIQAQQFHQPFTFDDLVREERIPEQEEGGFIQELLKQSRPLRPVRKQRTVFIYSGSV